MTFLSILLFLLGKQGRKGLAYFLAVIFYKIFGLRKKMIISNLDRAFGDEFSFEKKNEIGFLSTFNFLQTIFEFVSARDGKLGESVDVTGGEHLDKALKKGKGAFVLCCHMGNWEAMGGAFTKRFGPTHVIVKKVGSDSSDRFVQEMRTKNKFMFIDRSGGKGSATKAIFKALRRNEVVGFVMDQARPSEPKLPFFGHPAKTNTALAHFTQKSDIPVLPAFIIRNGPGSHTVHVREEIVLPKVENDDESILETSTVFNKAVEDIVKTCPEQYFWMHNRWKK